MAGVRNPAERGHPRRITRSSSSPSPMQEAPVDLRLWAVILVH